MYFCIYRQKQISQRAYCHCLKNHSW